MSEPESTKAVSKKKTKVHCLLCGFKPNPDLTLGGQVKELQAHWRNNEFKFKWSQDHYDVEEAEYQMAAGVSIIAALWTELDEITGPALDMMQEYKAWKASNVSDDPWKSDLAIEVDDLKKQLEMANKFKTGRGLAMAIKRMSHPYWDDVNEVVKHAVARVQAKKKGEHIFTPGTGNGEPADRAWYQQKNGKALPGCDDKPTAKPAQSTTPAAPAPTVPVAPAVEAPALTPETIQGIKSALAGGFTPERLADLYKLTVDQVRALA